jgi:hypothetical protein
VTVAGTDHKAQAERTLEMAADKTTPASDASRMALLVMAGAQASLAVCDRLDWVIRLLEERTGDASDR